MDDRQLQRAFEAGTLDAAAWTHRAHVRVAWLYLVQHPFDEAVARLRDGIRSLNARLGVTESPTSGYNETTTVAFAHIIKAVHEAYHEALPATDSEAFCDRHPQLLSPQLLRLFYSPERRMDPAAKGTFVSPDLAPLPRW